MPDTSGGTLGPCWRSWWRCVQCTFQHRVSQRVQDISASANGARSCFVQSLSLRVIAAREPKGEILVYPRRHTSRATEKKEADDTESPSTQFKPTANIGSKKGERGGPNVNIIQRQTAVFSWQDVVYDIKIKRQIRRILNHVDGLVVGAHGTSPDIEKVGTEEC